MESTSDAVRLPVGVAGLVLVKAAAALLTRRRPATALGGGIAGTGAGRESVGREIHCPNADGLQLLCLP